MGLNSSARDPVERIVTLPEAQISSGGLAESINAEFDAHRDELLRDELLSAKVRANANRHVDLYAAGATADILASGGDLSTIADLISRSFVSGLVTGLAIGVLSSGS